MGKRILHVTLALPLIVLIAMFLSGFSKQPITSLDQLAQPGTIIAVGLDAPAEKSLAKDYPSAKLIPYIDKILAYTDVANGRLDAYVDARREMEIAIMNGFKGVRLLEENYAVNKIAVAISPVSPIPNLTQRLNAFIRESKADGTLDDMYERWVIRGEETLPDIPPAKDPAFTLRVGTTGSVMPYSYFIGTELAGYDIELAHRFASWLGARLEFKVFDFGGIIAAAERGNIDCIMSNLFYSEEKNEALPFSDVLFEVEITAMVRDDGQAAMGNAHEDAQSADSPRWEDDNGGRIAGAAGYERLADLEDKRIGVKTGSVQALLAEERFPNARLYYFSTTVDMLNALRTHKIDAFAEADSLVKYLMADNPDLTYLDEPLGNRMQVGAIFPKTDKGQSLCDDYSAFIRQIRQNGVYDEIQNIWFGADESKRTIPDLDHLEATNGTLRVTVDTTAVPFAFIKDGKPAGLDIDTAVRFCEARGYGLQIVHTDFAGIIPAVVSGKADFACGGIAYTPERAQSVLYSESTFEGGSVLAVLKSAEAASPAGSGSPLWNGIVSSFNKTFIRENRWKLFVTGVLNTLIITLLSILCGTALGFLVFMLCRNGNPVSNRITHFSVWLIQGMPMVVLLMVLYYIIFASVDVNGIIVAVFGFTLTFGASVYGLLRMGVDAVDAGQYEAAYALGYSNRRTFFRIVLPQALPHILPAYQGDIVGLIKATAIVGYIAVQDLTKMGDIVRSRTYEAFFPLIAVTVIYFLLEGLLRALVSRITVNLDPRHRKPEAILSGIEHNDGATD